MAPTRKETVRRRQLGAARGRVRHVIYAEMMRRGYNGVRLAKELGCSSCLVSCVVLGRRHSYMVLDGLRRIGVPDEYLYDPRGGAGRVRERV